jgi:hypothetical protein
MLSQYSSLDTYLLLAGTQRLPLSRDKLGPLRDTDALEVWARLAFGEEKVPGRGWVLDVAIVGDGVGVRRCSLDLACELPPEQITRVVCKTNLFDCVGLDPGVVLGNTSLVELSGQVVQFLGGLLAQSIDGVRT